MALTIEIESPKNNPDGIGIEGAIKYLGDIKVQLDEVVCLGVAELLRSPSMGEFTREGFVDGWKNVKYVCSLHSLYKCLRTVARPFHTFYNLTIFSPPIKL